MPNLNELERQAVEAADARQGVEIDRSKQDRPLPKAEVFDITINFGPHQAKLKLDAATLSALDTVEGDNRLGRAIGIEIEPHIVAMLEAEEKMHVDDRGTENG
jgi:hypothetical protein